MYRRLFAPSGQAARFSLPAFRTGQEREQRPSRRSLGEQSQGVNNRKHVEDATCNWRGAAHVGLGAIVG
jgi:hypothetical protein